MHNIKYLIAKKRDGVALTADEIRYFINGYVGGDIADYQAAALLMAIYLNGMQDNEILAMTESMMRSGNVVDLSGIPGIKVDKHSTGGVGDKTTIVVMPLAAAAGVKVPKLTGRGMGHTGGSLDKFAVFEGIDLALSADQVIRQVRDIGAAITGQTEDLVPADKKLYALRDATATVAHIPLIACSVMSKKLASGSDAIVLDVKMGSGSFLEEGEEAFILAEKMVAIGEHMGRRTVALVTNMECPLGRAIGNTLEVREAFDVLHGSGPEDVRALCLALGAEMLMLGKICEDASEAIGKLEMQIGTGSALLKLRHLIEAQGGSTTSFDSPDSIAQAPYRMDYVASGSGYICRIDARSIGEAAMLLGAGRRTMDSAIDLSAGVWLNKKYGNFVNPGETLAVLHTSDQETLHRALERVENAFVFSDAPPPEQKLILGRVSRDGVEMY